MSKLNKNQESEIFEIVLKYLPNYSSEDINDTDCLNDLGLDSLNSINMLLDFEKNFGLVFPDECLTPENFATVSSIKSTINSLLNC